ncbi:YgjP-like metallopeptidase domain-containing protein [Poseidonibacter lekithochrous]|uniref:YgjP-like metallopeptidase domain-containing protein n=1 Tax=Poseidonibacter lekithochrous TaxID=1904463 RepID=UPI000D3627C7|nr:YgjP-like metallopeptidase domain-containing protein [Poseidonibacter lekithochrous]
MKQLQHYPQHLQDTIKSQLENGKLGDSIKKKYPNAHNIRSDKALYNYVMDLKNQYFKKFQLSKIQFDGKINVINNALGMHTFISRVQGNKLKAKNEIRVATIFKNVPEKFLEMIVVHELAHLKEKEHDKAFYDLCTYMMDDYHQVEFDLRVYLVYMDRHGKLY